MYFAHPIDSFALPNLQQLPICHVWFLFGVNPGIDSFSRHFGAINNKMYVGMSTSDVHLHECKIYLYL